jgi:ATP-dependent Clp protease ATP-binding subunit ClpA
MYETAGMITGVRPSAPLAETLRRAAGLAQQRAHRFVTLEHLLLALSDDPDAIAVLRGINANLPAVKAVAGDIVVRQLANLQASGPSVRPHPQLERLLQAASGCGSACPPAKSTGPS